jgi:uncharacterized protein YbaP (TraB family)
MRRSAILKLAYLLLTAAFCASVPAGVSAQQATENWNEGELVVRPPKGPAMWRVQKGNAEVWVIGVLPVIPKSQKWNSFGVQRALKGSKRLIAPPQVSMNPFDMISMMRNKNLPDKQTMKSVTSPDLYDRYLRVAARAGVSVSGFERDKPVWAIGRLRREVLQKQRLDEKEPARTIMDMARNQGVKVETITRVKVMTVYRPLNEMSMAGHINCLRHGLNDVEFDLDRAPKTAAAWAIGDLRTVHANYQGSTLVACLSGSGKAADTLDDSIEDAADAIEAALKTPGKSVAIVSLSQLLRQGGVLERLRNKGLSVTSPDL